MQKLVLLIIGVLIILTFRIEYEAEGPDVTLIAGTYTITMAWDELTGLNLWIYQSGRFILRYPTIEIDPVHQVPENLKITGIYRSLFPAVVRVSDGLYLA